MITPLSLSVFVPNALVVHPKLGIPTFQDYLKLVRAQPGKTSYASPGLGTPGHLSFELLKQLAKLDVIHVPYRGAGPGSTMRLPARCRSPWLDSPE
jgi:tripartite-type tricarboxylate transporter receptor subunit TctC